MESTRLYMQIVQNIYSKRWVCKLVLSFKAGNDAGFLIFFFGGGGWGGGRSADVYILYLYILFLESVRVRTVRVLLYLSFIYLVLISVYLFHLFNLFICITDI